MDLLGKKDYKKVWSQKKIYSIMLLITFTRMITTSICNEIETSKQSKKIISIKLKTVRSSGYL